MGRVHRFLGLDVGPSRFEGHQLSLRIGDEDRTVSGPQTYEDGDSVEVSDLKGNFAEHYQATRDLLYRDAKDQGWFPRRPDHVRGIWVGIGVVLTVLGVGGFVLAMMYTTWAVVVLPIPVLGVILIVGHRWMPHRTAKGSRLLDKTLEVPRVHRHRAGRGAPTTRSTRTCSSPTCRMRWCSGRCWPRCSGIVRRDIMYDAR